MLVVSSRHRLWQRYGPDGVFAIEQAVGDLIEAQAARGVAGTLVYTDDSALLGRLGVLPPEGGAGPVARMVRQVAARLAEVDEAVRYVLILGDDGVVPFDRPANPVPDDEGPLASDQIYAVDADGPLAAARAVGRMPDRGLGVLLAGLRAAASAHARLARGRALETPRAFGYSASVWKRAARGVFAAIGEPAGLRLSPPLTHRQLPPGGGEGPRFGYFNLHGLVDAPHWFGQRDPSFPADYDPYPVALRPEDFAPAPGSLVFSEACYGAHLGGRAVHDSIALTSLAGGTTAFAGATGVAYGGLDGRLVAADFLAHRFWEAILAGMPAGVALVRAKQALVADALARQGYVDAEDEKAVHNFVLYGDPSLTYHAPSRWAEDTAGVAAAIAVESAGPADLVGTSPVRPHSLAAPAFDPTSTRARADLSAYVQKTVARRLPEFAAADVTVDVAPAGGGPLAKGRPPAGRVPAGGPLVVTLARSVETGEGCRCREVLRATVDCRGTIRKLTLSR